MEPPDPKGRLIKDGAQVVREVENDTREITEFISKFDLMGVCNSIGIRFDDVTPVIISGDLGQYGVEVVEVMFSPR
jgi:hypothetical protein